MEQYIVYSAGLDLVVMVFKESQHLRLWPQPAEVTRDETLGYTRLLCRLDQVDLCLAYIMTCDPDGRDYSMNVVRLEDCNQTVDVIIIDNKDWQIEFVGSCLHSHQRNILNELGHPGGVLTYFPG